VKKILFGITGLTMGGAERVLVDIVNRLKSEYDITVFTLYAKGEFEKELSKEIKLKSLYPNSYSEMSKIKKLLISLKLLLCKKQVYKKHIGSQYDTQIAFLEGPITRLFSVKDARTKKIVWVHNDIEQVFGNNIKSKIKKKYDKKIYNNYEKIVFVSRDNLEKFQKQYSNIDKEKLEVIYNYINPEIVKEKAKEQVELELDANDLNIGIVARLVPQKALDRLIEVHTKLINDGYKHNIYVIGDGPQKEELEQLIYKNNVQNTFKLLGKKENPYPYMSKMSAIALLSHYEGYGMVLEEAKILGKYIIITDTAAREALQDYENSKILENSFEDIYEGIKELTQNKIPVQNTQQEYKNERILEEIKKIIEEK